MTDQDLIKLFEQTFRRGVPTGDEFHLFKTGFEKAWKLREDEIVTLKYDQECLISLYEPEISSLKKQIEELKK